MSIALIVAGILSSGSAVHAAAMATLLPVDKEEIRCLINKEVTACESAFARAPGSEDAFTFATVGCVELGKANSCLNLGDWLSAKGSPKAGEYYAKACTLNDMRACSKIIEIHRITAEKTEPAALKSLVDEVNAWTTKICLPETKLPVPCARAKVLAEEIQRRINPLFGDCQLNYHIYLPEGKAGQGGGMKSPTNISGLVNQEQCQNRCGGWVSHYVSTEPEAVNLRARCLFQNKPSGPAIWRQLASTASCSSETQRVGFDDQPLYVRCYCEMQIHGLIDQQVAKYGAVAVGEVGRKKNIGGREFFRCAIGFYFEDPEAERKDPERCQKDLKALTAEMKANKEAHRYELNFAGISCAAKEGG